MVSIKFNSKRLGVMRNEDSDKNDIDSNAPINAIICATRSSTKTTKKIATALTFLTQEVTDNEDSKG